jgi:2-amino-4-hydroxy-6-hydroxymethyldihydropteridine diphosphokinase
MILIALGSNMPGPWGTPKQAVERALRELDLDGITLMQASRLMVTAPYGKPNQPDFINAIACVQSHLPPMALLKKLHALEKRAGRRRALRWGPRTLDLDIIDYNGHILNSAKLKLPHPGIADRIFVLKPIAEMKLRWRHPVLRMSALQLLLRLKGYVEGQEI